MERFLGDATGRVLRAIFELGAENASAALTRWLRCPVQVTISSVEELQLEDAVAVLGTEESLVAACSMDLAGRLGGELLLVFEDRAGLALADLILGLPDGTSVDWTELEQSAALETANIVGCAFLNSIGSHLPSGNERDALIPAPPIFRREFAGALLEFALMDQVMSSDRLLLVRSRFEGGESELAWWLLFVPSGATYSELSKALGPGGSR